MGHFISYVFTEDEIIMYDLKLLQERLMKTYQVTSSSKGRYVQLPIAYIILNRSF